ncbi:MAG: regulatory protein GemA [Rhodospirillaceae bacterium]|nr:regulatory protein GemA [Rhodospirillaceae bacterium]
MTAAPKYDRYSDGARKGLIGKIHVAKSQLGLDDATYRAVLERVTGKASSKECSFGQLEELRREFERMGWKPVRVGPRRAGKRPLADGDLALKLRALWLSGYHLGVIREPAEGALAAFVKRVTGGRDRGVDALQWLTAADASKAIEALKAILAREADVEWKDNPRAAVIRAQYQICVKRDLVTHASIEAWCAAHGFPMILTLADDTDLDRLIARLGTVIRVKAAPAK